MTAEQLRPNAEDSARMALARARALERRHRQSIRLRPILWLVLAVVLISALQDRPYPGTSGAGLGVSIALAVNALATAVAAAGRWPGNGQVSTALLAVVLGVSGTVLAGFQPSGLATVPVSAAVMLAYLRLPFAVAGALAVPLTVGIAITSGLTSEAPGASATATILLCVVLAAAAVLMRQARDSQDRTELLMAELEDARAAEASAAALAERGRIARELHDVLAQSLSALAIQLEGARKLAERDQAGPALTKLIARSGELTREGLADARRAVGALRGDDVPTIDQLNELVERCRRDFGMPISLSVTGEPRPLDPQAELALYRGAQEALTNAARYAGGAPASVVLGYSETGTRLTVSDTGAGTDGPPPQAWTGGGNGLNGMRERIERAGGSVRAGPADQGWTVEMEIPE